MGQESGGRCWWVLGCGSVAAIAAGLVGRRYFDAAVRLSSDRHVPATTVLVVLALGSLVMSVVGRRHRRLAMLVLAGLAFGLSASWLALTTNRFSGPVLFNVGRDRGVHLTDLGAVAPAAAGVALLLQTARLTRITRAVRATVGRRPVTSWS